MFALIYITVYGLSRGKAAFAGAEILLHER
jgi:hypothetical protein